MHLHPAILFISTAPIASVCFGQDKNAQTLGGRGTINIKTNGAADALRELQSLRLTDKLLGQQGQVQLAYARTKKRPGEVRTEASLQGMTQVEAYDGKDGWKVSPFFGRAFGLLG